MIINCIIVDDEPLARKGLKEYVTDVDFLKLVGEFENPLKATELISSGDVQLLFLDIQMPKITGLDFFRTLQNAPPVIFTTAYPQYALEGFEVNALDYLVKPISFDRFLKAAMKAREYYEVRETNEKEKATTDYFFIKTDNKLVKILFEDVLFVEALQNYVTIHTLLKKYMTYLTFKSVEEYLPADKFLKVHKSYIVAASKVDSIEGNDIRIGQQHIPISRNQKDEVMEKLLKGKFLKR
ncbi:MAG: response regulator transcription factor [Chitinophagaceae bacterium]|jgi:DNA-binding LytR/AlgR family response regulator|nr:response regulator transcription factor [Chitinophagaceae bacterium]MBK7678321.1 response regulator transcription factor [Chitinophagaceae bacterium]MBK8301473.1 response regulator transcription factor [Chitinophagaceae bacterium]MBK9464628.1 response regulator transcription factor [Chitinophagaceae bacterium]MBK9660017.1 response regulator transcription factor [Chitinophagaceae bacterium]